MTAIEAYENIVEVLAELGPEKVVQLKATQQMADRVEWLLNQKRNAALSPEESVELERYLSLDLLINLAQARAKKLLTS